MTFVILYKKWYFLSLQISFLQNPYLKGKYVESFGNIGQFLKQRTANSHCTDAFFSRFNSWSVSVWSKAERLKADSKSAKYCTVGRGVCVCVLMLVLILSSLLSVCWVTPAFYQGKCLKNCLFYFNFLPWFSFYEGFLKMQPSLSQTKCVCKASVCVLYLY